MMMHGPANIKFVFQLMTNTNLEEMEWVCICGLQTSGSG